MISTSVAIVAQVIEETLKQKSTEESVRDAAAAAGRSEKVVMELARVLQPLHIDHIFVHELEVPLAHETFSRLRSRFDQIAQNYRRQYEQMRLRPKEPLGVTSSTAHCPSGPRSCAPLSVELNSKHPSFPARGLESAVFRIHSITVAIYRTPINPMSAETMILGGPNTPDLYLTFGR